MTLVPAAAPSPLLQSLGDGELVEFVAPEAWIEQLGRSIAFLEGRVTSADGDVLATATSTVKLVPVDRGQ